MIQYERKALKSMTLLTRIPSAVWLVVAGLSGAVVVVAGAYGYHWIDYVEASQKDIFNTGVQYHMWHTLALLAVALAAVRAPRPEPLLTLVALLFSVGMVLFCGTLYLFGLTLILLPTVAPVGGMLMILGWLVLAWQGGRWLRDGDDQ